MRVWLVGQHTLIIFKHTSWMLNWNSKHSKLAAKISKMLTARFHCYELRTKTWHLKTPMFILTKKDRSIVKKHDKSSSWETSNWVSSMIGINKLSHREAHAFRCRSIGSNILFSGAIRWCRLIFSWKLSLFNIMISMIKHCNYIALDLEERKHFEYCIQVTFMRKSHHRSHSRHLHR